MAKSSSGCIKIRMDGEVGWLIISNPDYRNAMNLSMYQQIPKAVSTLLSAHVRVIVVRGHGEEAFGAGSDISEFLTLRKPENARTYDEAEALAHSHIEHAPVPTIAMIQGPCRGGGLAIALACDLRYASSDATFAAPPAKLGIGFPHSAVTSLTQIIGDANARRLLLTAATIDATEAMSIGIVHAITDRISLVNTIDEITTGICQLSPRSLNAAKTSLANLKGQRSSNDVQDAISRCYTSNDYQEGIMAFLEKRSPDFDGT